MAAKKHEVLYIMGVAHFRLGRYVQARYRAKAALEIVPDMRQAVALKERAEDEMATEGLIGLGIATGVAVQLVQLVVAAAHRAVRLGAGC